MTSIVYMSASGFTKQYALMLSAQTGFPVFDLREAKKTPAKGSDIIYMGWIMAGGIKGYSAAVKNYTLRAVCAVGMRFPTDNIALELKERHKMGNIKLFYLQGGFDLNKLRGFYRFIMKSMAKSIINGIQAKPEKSTEDAVTLDMLKNGRSMVSEEYLAEAVKWIKENQI